jgi:hypothetical protein
MTPVGKVRPVRDLSASIPVRTPAGFAVAFLNTYMSDRGGEGGKANLPLRHTITQLAGLTLERDVTVQVEYLPQPGDATAELRVAWEPDAGLFPSFSGILRAQPTGDTDCVLTLDGTYDAPGGVAGQLFDAVIGVRIAHGTLEELLEQLRAAIEADYRTRMEYSGD